MKTARPVTFCIVYSARQKSGSLRTERSGGTVFIDMWGIESRRIDACCAAPFQQKPSIKPKPQIHFFITGDLV
jgi:hypothetical protein